MVMVQVKWLRNYRQRLRGDVETVSPRSAKVFLALGYVRKFDPPAECAPATILQPAVDEKVQDEMPPRRTRQRRVGTGTGPGSDGYARRDQRAED